MRRFIMLSLCLALVLSFFSGCGDNSNPAPSTTYTVSGKITRQDNGLPLEGVTLSFSNGQSITTGPDGTWTNSDLSGTVTLTPSREGWAFEPQNRQLKGGGVNANFTAKNGSNTTYAVSGKIINQTGDGIGSVVLTFGSGFGTATTGSDGTWNKVGLWGRMSVTPAKNGWAFTPVSQNLSGQANNINFTGWPGAPPSAAPTNLAASIQSPSQVTLTWTDNSDNEQEFNIERKTGVWGSYYWVGTVAANVQTYTDSSLNQSMTYYFRVMAHNGYGDSNYSNEVQVNTPSGIPAVPSGLTAYTISSTQINLSWTDNSDNETGFKIERKTWTGGIYSQITTVPTGTTSYQSTGLAPGYPYYYRVRAYNTYGDSEYSLEVSASTENTAPAASFTATPNSGTIEDVFQLDASNCSDRDDPVSTLQVRWDWENDGVWDTAYSTTKLASHQFFLPGTYTVKLEVEDSGGLTANYTVSLSVLASAGTIIID